MKYATLLKSFVVLALVSFLLPGCKKSNSNPSKKTGAIFVADRGNNLIRKIVMQ